MKQKGWSRGELGEDTPQMYSTIDGHLTPTAPVYEDMRTNTTVNETLEESLVDLACCCGRYKRKGNYTRQMMMKEVQYQMLHPQLQMSQKLV